MFKEKVWGIPAGMPERMFKGGSEGMSDPMQDYKSLRAAVMICAPRMVNTRTDTETVIHT